MADSRPPRLAGQSAIVTGGSSGIGRATCLALAREGARVAVVGTNRGRIDAVLEEIGRAGLGDAAHLGAALDVRDETALGDLVGRARRHFGRIDILVACAGILRPPGTLPKPLAQVSSEEWDQVIDINLKGVFLTNRAVLPTMMEQRSGQILNVSSVSGRQGRAHDAPYCASKFGIVGLTESLAEEVRNHGIRVQVLLPDAVDTPIWRQNGPVPMPPNALAPERVADLIVEMLALPADALLVSPIVAPFRTRRPGRGRGARRGPAPRPAVKG